MLTDIMISIVNGRNPDYVQGEADKAAALQAETDRRAAKIKDALKVAPPAVSALARLFGGKK